MKKLFLSLTVVLFTIVSANAQKDHGAIKKGQFQVEINTGANSVGATGFSLSTSNGNTAWSVGAEGSYFVLDNLGIKVGLGYTSLGSDQNVFNYKVGAKYYIANQFPVGVDFTGASAKNNSVNWVGIQGGYALFLTDNLSIEPTIRFNTSTDTAKASNFFQGLIGFAYHF
ncbi:hypothetical protein [Polaribacter cellanae]|uniref:Outer membrane protein beta-barrel domain-containing protein n=1 Tax=Polaribacter cellanae TaxID=2818493 RepID=A0A975H7E1_9FLAO|nr:hypothetical protein [Polaribacter cellanae]QTE23372.1 hypothetical protein J3359_03585 [Polaribacter cellanae]